MATQTSSPSAHPADAPVIRSDLEEFVATVSSPSELDQVPDKFAAQTATILPDSVFNSSVPDHSSAQLDGMPTLVTDPSPIAAQVPMNPASSFMPDAGIGFASKSSPLVSATSDCLTPTTPLSHGSASSPMAQPVLLDGSTVSLPSLYPSTTDNALLLPSTPSLSPSHTDVSKPDLPPPPKRPLTPYMRFSKKVTCFVTK